ncbi:uncharacterized protein MCYG_07763 [Microsporum canis CBS 113480]|uniref:Uncharacterized protein n=1 Tax=Arthroderma otae (strain ATCC MYA-4605 / CBS 113480) TaxID=554155 RepID=C5FXA4_ARTOC|nr:uncharacterized protein MCYG_07763 [Microsporum canis CBS 113480]EEQ34944.1 predicted protein [Microsporum canis CBS 113480]
MELARWSPFAFKYLPNEINGRKNRSVEKRALSNASINRFQWYGKVGTEGDMPCEKVTTGEQRVRWATVDSEHGKPKIAAEKMWIKRDSKAALDINRLIAI